MTRKRTMVEQCGNMTSHYILTGNVTLELLCALRIHIMNETELDVMCPMQDGAFWAEEKKCEGGGFDWQLPISIHNENLTINALEGTIKTLQKGYKTTIEEDDNLLQMSSISKITRAAIAVRKREKQLIESVLAFLADRRANLESLPHQIEAIKEKERLRKKALKESKPRAVIEFPIDLGGGRKPNFTVYEGQDLEQVAKFFAQTNGLTDAGLRSIIASARKRVKRQARLEFFTSIVLAEGLKAGIRVFEGENVSTVVRRFCALHNLTDHQTNLTEIAVRKKYKKRINRSILVSFPVTVPDG